MKHSNKNKILGLGIFLSITLIFLISNPFNFSLKRSAVSKSITKNSSENPSLALNQSTETKTAAAQPIGAQKTLVQTATPAQMGNSPTLIPSIPSTPPTFPTPSVKVPPPTLIAEGCFKLTFTHKKQASHEDGEACLLHKNLIVLSHSDQAKKSKIDPRSICIRINDKAVKYSLVPNKPGQIILGPEAGPNAKITASYCVGKAKCLKSCIPEKDAFLSAIGAEENNDSAQAIAWDGQKGKSKEEAEVETQMTALSQELNPEGNEHSPIFSGWILETQIAQCEQNHVFESKVAHLNRNERD